MTSVYSLRSSTLGYRVTKFTDGEPEGSYHTSHAECDCPAGSRPSCRHRQMLPRMLGANLLDSPAFWDHDHNLTCDIDGVAIGSTIRVRLPDDFKVTDTPLHITESMALPKGPEIEPLPAGVQLFNLAETSPAELFNAIAEAVGEPTISTKPQPFRRRL